jgi:hypothetical protein
MKKLLLILLCLPFIGFGQNVNIPDAIFKASLVGSVGINTNGDSEIQVSEANLYNGPIWCNNMNISDLTGIEYFTALTTLYCQDNQLTSLDVSTNTALEVLRCHNNQLTSLDVSQNTALTVLECSQNNLTTLDVSQNTALTELECDQNNLTTLDVSQNTALTSLFCYNMPLTSLDVSGATALTSLDCEINNLTSLDVSQNTDLTKLICNNNQLTSLNVRNGNNMTLVNGMFSCSGNPNLFCINVDDAAWSTANWTVANGDIDTQHYFSNNCPPSAIQEHTTNKELLKVTDLLGRKTKQTNQPLFYIYDDGTVEKRIVIE